MKANRILREFFFAGIGRIAVCFLFGMLSISCEQNSFHPRDVLGPRLEGTWQAINLDSPYIEQNGLNSVTISIVEKVKDGKKAEDDKHIDRGVWARLSVQLTSGEFGACLIVDGKSPDSLLGPWMVFDEFVFPQDPSVNLAWGDRAWVNLSLGDTEGEDILLVAFGEEPGGHVNPHRFRRSM